jgi:hypothetical protein
MKVSLLGKSADLPNFSGATTTLEDLTVFDRLAKRASLRMKNDLGAAGRCFRELEAEVA